ncbi:MAG TPA: hypothetical protein VIW24_18605 [Aldersonia sp.]
MTSRNQSGLPMSRMRMRDELVEIDATVLRFDAAESETCEDPARLIGTMTGRHHAISEVPRRERTRHAGTVDAGVPAHPGDHRKHLRELASTLSGMPGGQAMLEQIDEADPVPCAASTNDGSVTTTCSSSSCGKSVDPRCQVVCTPFDVGERIVQVGESLCGGAAQDDRRMP